MAKTITSRRTPLSNERIVAAAVELIDRGGLEALSMRHLGAALGVEAMSLYRHFPSKTALLEAVVGRLLAELLLRHPNAIPLLATLQLSNPGALGAAGAVMALLRNAGFDARTSFYVLATVESYVIGFAYWEAGTAGQRADGRQRPPLPPGADPYLVEHWNEVSEQDCDAAFEFGLDVFVAGLERART